MNPAVTGTLAVQLYSVHEALVADRPATLKRLADLGYRYVEPFALGFWNTPADELTSAARALRDDLDAVGLAVTSVHTSVSAHEQRGLVEMCRILGTDTAFVPIPFLVEGFEGQRFEDRDAVALFADRLNAAAREVAASGVRLGYHNHHLEWEQLPDGARAFDVLWERLDPDVLAEVDLYWAAVAGQDPAEVVERLGERAVAAHVKDGPARPDTPQTPLGTGDVDYAAALRAGRHLRWHITEIDDTAGDRFELLATNRRTLLDGGLTAA
ncbi:sugar phosphate isomerase/epimerase [Streptomyces sp. NBC_01352]|uniref:sugar phosphate isomerase/epimerase family protein n=1 Tax=unclassified Streptomyces TaxID=2593676 RepID=UPI00225858FC|nr:MULTISPECIES: sugar phosphate isomerase/epimerase [unclassified Streptomyces]MCX4704280.1 sugar phosphate isomerase/epimerase [Streptomyces sp. NBC_01373]